MEFLKEVLGEGYPAFAERVEAYNKAHPEESIKLANLSAGGYVSREKYATLETEAKGYKAQMEERDKQLKELEKAAGAAPELEQEIARLREENKAAKEGFEGELSKLKLDAAIDRELLKAKAVDVDLVKVKLDRSVIQMNEAGELTGLSDQLETVQKEYGFLFQNQAYKPANGGTAGAEPKNLRDALAEQYQNQKG